MARKLGLLRVAGAHSGGQQDGANSRSKTFHIILFCCVVLFIGYTIANGIKQFSSIYEL